MTSRCRFAVTLGDPRGVGPELTATVLADPLPDLEVVLVGPDDLIEALPATRRIGVGTWRGGAGHGDPADPETRRRALRAGTLAGRAIEQAAALALAGEVDALVTAPIEKYATHLAGYPWPGHTEWLAALAGGVDVAMMLATDTLRVVLVTTHVALRDVPALLTTDRIVRTGQVTRHALREWFGIADPRLALCALNPHAGEGGLFGDEEARILAPAAVALQAAGPLPADTVFVRAMEGQFDAVLAPYHDVGMTAIKVAGFGHGVNITLGLPFPRTSPDHGTAMDIAGTGTARPDSMRRAFALAATLGARNRAGRTEDEGQRT